MDDEDALGVVEDPVDLGICNGAGFLEMRLLYGVYDPCRQGGAILVNIGHRGVAHLEARALGGTMIMIVKQYMTRATSTKS